MNETTARLLESHVAAMNKINADGAAHVQRICETHVRAVERYATPLETIADDVLPEPRKDGTHDAAAGVA